MSLVDVDQLLPTWSDELDENVPRVNITYEVFMILFSLFLITDIIMQL